MYYDEAYFPPGLLTLPVYFTYYYSQAFSMCIFKAFVAKTRNNIANQHFQYKAFTLNMELGQIQLHLGFH